MFHVKQKSYDIVVVGAGHAGVEAATMASRLGLKVAIVTFNSSDFGTLSCNPAMGGLGKGHLIKEIDALGGLIGVASDMSGIQFRVLNKTRGAAVQGPRAQIDRNLYRKNMFKLISEEKVEIILDEVEDIITVNEGKKNILTSITLSKLGNVKCNAIVVTTGTFLSGRIFRGDETWEAGRLGSKPSIKLAKFFLSNFRMTRLKTGTPPRIKGDSIDYEKCIIQEGDVTPAPFSFINDKISTEQVCCHITKTNAETHSIIKANLNKSSIYSGKLKSKGPRYCPSIEDKIKRFAEKESHQIFLEPETKEKEIIYPNGISNSLPSNIQKKFIRSIPGLENCMITDYGYAIEYDCVDSSELKKTFETKKINGLYLAGQINGTTGYEEAAAQGLMAGINAARKLQKKDEVIIQRSQGYIGVLTSDLCKGGLIEPYRMFTSRAEYRLLLRADNADERFTDIGIELGTICGVRKRKWLKKKKVLAESYSLLSSLKASPQTFKKNGIQINQDGKKRSALELLAYKDVSWNRLEKIWPKISSLKMPQSVKKQIRNTAFYDKYTHRLLDEIAQLNKEADLKIGNKFDFRKCSGLSNEVKESLEKYKPENFGEAKNLPGMTPAAAAILLSYVKK